MSIGRRIEIGLPKIGVEQELPSNGVEYKCCANTLVSILGKGNEQIEVFLLTEKNTSDKGMCI